jgi:DNA-binding beta-propeller fold protein YncE
LLLFSKFYDTSKDVAMRSILSILTCLLFGNAALAQDDPATLAERGKVLYFERVSCWVCHGDNAEGGVGPTLQHGPTPMDIQEQLDSNPQMGVIVAELDPDAEDLVALAVYLGSLSGDPVSATQISGWRTQLAAIEAARAPEEVFYVSDRDRKVMDIMSFDTVLEDWTRHARTGSLKGEYDVKVLATYEPGEQVFFPEADELYFYENVGTNARRAPPGTTTATSTSVVVGNARTKEIIASREMPRELRGAVHTTVLSPDGRYIYIIGPSSQSMGAPAGASRPGSVLRTPATMLKVDALTLQPIKQLAIGGRLHHGQIFQDRYLLMDTFISDPDGLDVFLFDPETDEIIGGVRSADLGGSNYTSYTDNEFIYILMQPGGDGGAIGGANGVASGSLTVLRPYWVTKIDPTNWEVVAEYPYSGYRGDWIIIDSKSENIYIPASGSSNVTKINLGSGAVEWSAATGTGPYGGTLTADEKEIWISNKGEATGAIGRTLTVVDTASGRPLETVFSGYMSDHVLLSPNGKEMWVTSNGEGRIYVFDAATKEQLHVIDMPGRGDPHGLVWVKYDDDGSARVVRDQGGFHNGVHPARGKPLLD